MDPAVIGILETVLYASNLDDEVRFFGGILGLTLERDNRPLSISLRAGPNQMLLVFDPLKSGQAGREVPSHGALGSGHAALRIDPGEYDAWLARLGEAGIDIEQEQEWTGGHRSIYMRDPAGNSIELVTGDLWAS